MGIRVLSDGAGQKHPNGFTLVEIMVAIAVIAVLLAISIPAFVGAIDKAKLAADCANYRDAKTAAGNASLDLGINGVNLRYGSETTYYYDIDKAMIVDDETKPEGYGKYDKSYNYELNQPASLEEGGVIAEGKVLKVEFYRDDPLPHVYWVE